MDIMVRNEGESEAFFQVKSNMEFRFLVSLKVNFINEETFVDGILTKGWVKNEMIGFKENEASISKSANGYDLLINGTKEPIDDKEIKYTVTKIYTQEPENGQKVFSQYYGIHFTFEKTGEHQYKFQSPEGDNFYTYQYGVCTDIRIERDFATIHFRLQPDSFAAVKSGRNNFKNR